jgi:hypothetical protein
MHAFLKYQTKKQRFPLFPNERIPRMRHKKALVLMLASLMLAMAATAVAQTPQAAPLPNPVLYFVGSEFYTAGGKDWTRYKFEVDNFSAYPDTLFAAAPSLPPCGTNTNSSRTWVDVFDSRGKRLYGFCAFGKASNLNQIWFAVERDVIPPSYVYIEMNDRQTSTKYKSNLADTVE